MATCSRCGEDNSKRARFCSACGAPLGREKIAAREMRKTVTVVFSDVIGSTSLGDARDPESMRRVMSRYFDEARAVHERHGGTVEKFIGDAVMAVFGIPTLHEDDALRAVRAAAEMRTRLDALNEELERDWGVRLQVRTGVNTGEVVAGDASGGQAFATGDAVNVAKRFEEAAPAGEILLGESTFRLVRDAVAVEAVEPLELKGKAGQIAAYRLLDVALEGRGGTRRLDAPMVGREHERTLLEQAYARAVRERSCHLFTLLGPAGVGKSRLAAEVIDSLRRDATVLVGRCLPYGEGITFWPLVEVVHQAAGLREDDAPDEARAKVESLLAGSPEAPTIADRVAHAVGLPAAPASPDETFWGIRKLFEALAQPRPLVVVFDDVHWAESTFLDLIEHVGDWARDAPILLLCLARAELLDQRPAWGGGKLNATSILLEPLTGEECSVLIGNLLGQADLPESVCGRISDAAEGNPLFVEEMLAMLIDDGLLRRQNGHWAAADDLAEVAVPPTIQALLAARLDRLEDAEREVIGRASVEGKVFHRGAVLELAPEVLRPEVPTRLLTLQRKELIRPSRSDFAGEDAFRFRHLLIRDAAYEAIPKQLRAELHERFAGWLEATAGERAREYEEIIGYHLEQAYYYGRELGPPDERARALAHRSAERLGAAGKRALAREDVGAARSLLSRAHSLVDPEERLWLELAPELAEALAERGEHAEAEALLAEAVERARARGKRGLEAHAQVQRAYMRIFSRPEGAGDEALRVAKQAMPIFEELDDAIGIAKAARLANMVLFQRGHLAETAKALELALARLGQSRDISIQAATWHRLMSAYFWGATPFDEFERRSRKYQDWAAVNRVQGRMLSGGTHFAVARAMRGHFDEARRLIDKGTRTLEGREPPIEVLMGKAQHGGWIENLAGDPSAAERVQREGYKALEAVGESGYRSTLAGELAQSIYAQGRYDEADRFAEISKDAAASDDVTSQSLWRGVRAKVLARRGELTEAERLAREGLAMVEKTEFVMHHSWALLDLAEVLRLAGTTSEAAGLAEKALSLYERKGCVVMAEKTRALLADLAAA
ncbi:MAG: adenylate/guanylate cyclase domain-containing protein [Actinomycetota bacterium]